MRAALRFLLTATLSMALPATSCALMVCNAGFPGDNSAQLLQRLPKALVECGSPAEVVIFVGMNDAVNEKRFRTPSETAAAVEHMLRMIHEAHADALVVTVHYPDATRLMQRHSVLAFGGLTPAERIDATNNALRRAAQKENAVIVDFQAAASAAVAAPTILGKDGVHLTSAGYRLLAQKVAEALPKQFSGTVLCLGDSLTFGIGVRAADVPDAGSDSYPQQLIAILDAAL